MSPIAPTGSPIRRPGRAGRASLEDRLSDTLHQSLMQRFVDRRTSALLRRLNQRAGPILGGIDAEGAVTVEGHLVGRLAGFHFEPERGATALENRALRGAVERVVAPEVARRLGALASEADEAFALAPGGVVNWRGEAAGEIVGGEPFAPRVRLIGEFGAEPQRERAARRLEAFAAAEATPASLPRSSTSRRRSRTGGSRDWRAASPISSSSSSGALDRRAADARIRLLSRNERRTLKALGVRFGAFSLYLPSLLEPKAQLLAVAYAELASASWRPDPGGLNALPRPSPRPQALALRGLRAVGQLAAPIAELERLDALAARRVARRSAERVDATDALLADLGWRRDDAHHILRALGFQRVRDGEGAERALFRRRRAASDAAELNASPVATPFAALAALTKPAERRPRRRKRRRGRPPDTPPRDGRRLPDRCLALARPFFQDKKPGRAHRRGRRRASRARPIARAGRQAEPPGPLRRRADLRARPEMGRGQG